MFMPNDLKTWTEVAVHIATIVGIYWAIRTYRENQSLERSKWASSLYEKFYEQPDLKGVRRVLDCTADDKKVSDLVQRGESAFTDYLNFFEHVTYLVKCNQIRRVDADAYFNYYLSCLRRHRSVLDYVQNQANGYEVLAEFLKR